MTTAEDKQVAFTKVWLETRTRDFWIGIATRPTTWLDSFLWTVIKYFIRKC